MRIFSFFLLAGLWGLALAAPPLRAHPHAWIDMRTTIQTDDAGRLVALRPRWLFDDYYTAYGLEEYDANNNGTLEPDELLALARDNMRHLEPFGFFTRLEAEGRVIGFAAPEKLEAELVGGRIALAFTLPLTEPVDLTRGEVLYRMYDPTYYISMLHEKKESVRFDGPTATSCTHRIDAPQPDFQLIQYAAAFDPTDETPEHLGLHFAEKVVLSCP